MNRNPYDQLAGDIVELLLEDAGVVEREHRVSSASQRLDAVFIPTPQGVVRLRRLGLLGRMARRVCAFEFFHNAPSERALRAVVRKHLAWQHRREQRGARDLASLWVVCAARPGKALRAARARRSPGWPRGVYDLHSGLLGVRVVVVGELARVPDTLTLRMMGRGKVLRAASDEFDRLTDAALRRALASAMVEFSEREREEEAMSPRTDYLRKKLQDLLDEGRAKGLDEGRAKGLDEGRAKGLDEGRARGLDEGRAKGYVEVLTGQFERRLGRPLTSVEAEALRGGLDRVGPARMGEVVLDLDAAALAAWLRASEAR